MSMPIRRANATQVIARTGIRLDAAK